MAGISLETLRGYVLEEILARLIQNTGYRLLVDASQDPDELMNRSNGLVVRGRGGLHQVDVLGELAWIPAFTFPLRLIVEAKARAGKTGIDDVRNAFGVIADVNQNYVRTSTKRAILTKSFSYRYALFSTSGFSQPAADYALAHEISLVDLGTPDFRDVVDLADRVARILWGEDPPSRAEGYVKQMRSLLRRALGTWPEDAPNIDFPDSLSLRGRRQEISQALDEGIRRIGELFVGMANGPYLLLLRASDPVRLLDLLDREPVQDVSIHWSSRDSTETQWRINFLGRDHDLSLTFNIPKAVAEWIFAPDANHRQRAYLFKETFFSSITIYRHVNGRDAIYRLRYAPLEVEL